MLLPGNLLLPHVLMRERGVTFQGISKLGCELRVYRLVQGVLGWPALSTVGKYDVPASAAPPELPMPKLLVPKGRLHT